MLIPPLAPGMTPGSRRHANGRTSNPYALTASTKRIRDASTMWMMQRIKHAVDLYTYRLRRHNHMPRLRPVGQFSFLFSEPSLKCFGLRNNGKTYWNIIWIPLPWALFLFDFGFLGETCLMIIRHVLRLPA